MAARSRDNLRDFAREVFKNKEEKIIYEMIDSFVNKTDDEWFGTQAEYDALGVWDDNVMYYIIAEED